MRNPSENFKNRAETAREADTGIDTLFEPQIRQLGGVLVDMGQALGLCVLRRQHHRSLRLWAYLPVQGLCILHPGFEWASMLSGNSFTPPELITLSWRPNHSK